VTKTNWEGVGVKPDHDVAPKDARVVADPPRLPPLRHVPERA
jgi:hypothetical protein